MTQLSLHFSLEELSTTSHRELDNAPPAEVIHVLRQTAQYMEEVRLRLGSSPIHISSGYRSAALNKLVSGAKTSAHITGHAVDFICPAFGTPLEICRALVNGTVALPFDQLIEEGTWVHISFDPRMRNQVLTKRPGGGFGMGLPV